MKKLYRQYTIPMLVALVAIALNGCTRYQDLPPFFEEPGDTTSTTLRKVLFIGIDGLSGTELNTLSPTVFKGMEAHSKYSYDALSDERTTDAASWKTLMSGVSFSRHKIFDSSFIYTQSALNSDHAPIATYPSFFNFILSSIKSDLRTSLVSSWPTMFTRLMPEISDQTLAANDLAVKDSAIRKIKTSNTDLMVVHFNAPAIAGKAGAFSATNALYKEAVEKTDAYIGEILASVKERSGYNKTEEWLIIVAGTHGGAGSSYGGSSLQEATIPLFFYNERMTTKQLTRQGSFTGVQFKNRDAAAITGKVLDDGGLYNAGVNQQTIQLKIKGTAGAYPHFFSKMATWPSTPGWSMFTAGSSWAISVRSTTSGEARIQAATNPVFDNNWHTLTVVFADSASKRWVRRYTDGVRNDQTDVTGHYNNGGSYTSTSPLTLGWGADKTMPAVSIYAADIMIFNTALTDAEIQQNRCLPNANITTHPRYSNLIGFWPGNDGFSNAFGNLAPGQNKPFSLSGAFTWAGEVLPCTSPPLNDPKKASVFLKSVDVASTIFYWLKIPTQTSWGLEGNPNILTPYEIEFIQ